MLFSEPKIPQSCWCCCCCWCWCVSVLFSEPKIPQTAAVLAKVGWTFGFSALQRAENSSKLLDGDCPVAALEFQCSSASRKFLKVTNAPRRYWNCSVSVLFSEPKIPQTSARRTSKNYGVSFSALQRAENSSNIVSNRLHKPPRRFSALQRAENSSKALQPSPPTGGGRVSVLFSEPKIPQNEWVERCVLYRTGFSALQRAENSSNAKI